MRRYVVPGLLMTCTVLVAFWIVASQRHAQPFKPFNLTYHDFTGYRPEVAGCTITPVAVTSHDPAEPNIAVYGVSQESGLASAQLLVRLVHGYNMPMCMKIKGYTVEAIPGVTGSHGAANAQNSTTQQPSNAFGSSLPMQVWRVTSSVGEVSIWVTTMIRSEDFAVTTVDVTSMAFPRVDVPDDPNWVPKGFSREDLKHPVQSLRTWFRARWNASRTDPLTFLRLRQPAWASEELITYVSRSLPPSVTPEQEPVVIRQVMAGHAAMLQELQKWRRARKAAQQP